MSRYFGRLYLHERCLIENKHGPISCDHQLTQTVLVHSLLGISQGDIISRNLAGAHCWAHCCNNEPKCPHYCMRFFAMRVVLTPCTRRKLSHLRSSTLARADCFTESPNSLALSSSSATRCCFVPASSPASRDAPLPAPRRPWRPSAPTGPCPSFRAVAYAATGRSSSRLASFLGALSSQKPQGSLKNLKALSFVAIPPVGVPRRKTPRGRVACGPPV